MFAVSPSPRLGGEGPPPPVSFRRPANSAAPKPDLLKTKRAAEEARAEARKKRNLHWTAVAVVLGIAPYGYPPRLGHHMVLALAIILVSRDYCGHALAAHAADVGDKRDFRHHFGGRDFAGGVGEPPSFDTVVHRDCRSVHQHFWWFHGHAPHARNVQEGLI